MNNDTFKNTFRKIPAAAFGLVFMLIAGLFISDHFWTGENLRNMGVQGTVLVILAMAQAMVILAEGIDLSSGPLVSLCGVVIALCLHMELGIFEVLLIAVILGAAGGLVNGILVAKVKLQPFVATFGMMGVFTGLALVITHGSSIAGFSESFRFIAGGELWGFPFPLVLLVLMIILTYVLLYHTPFGTYVFSIGGNQETVRLAGVNDIFYKAAIYAVAGSYAGIAAIIMTSRLNAAHPLIGIGLEFEAIAAVIVGGNAWNLGNGSLVRTLVGVATIIVLKNGLSIMGIQPAIQVAAVGAFLILAVVYDALRGN